MTDRPSVLSAKVDKQAEIIADADGLKATDKANRPNSATMNDVRNAYRNAMNELSGPKGSVAEVEQTETPTERLE